MASHLDIWLDLDRGVVVEGPDSANLASLSIVQEDTLELVLHGLRIDRSGLSGSPYVEVPVPGTQRAALGRIDAPPVAGTFRLAVGGQQTAALNWSATADPVAWKAAVLTALQGLSTVGSGAVTLSDPAGTPANIFYFTWTDSASTVPITVVENRLLPTIDATHVGTFTPFGYTQQIKLAQFPLAMTTNFSRPTPPPVTVGLSRAGATGVNAEQTLSFPDGVSGSVSFGWAGAQTASLDVSNVTAGGLALVLNAIIADGATNPSFTVTPRTAAHGQLFNVEFTGPLAGASQPLLTVSMQDQAGQPWVIGTLDLSAAGRLPIEQALNGQLSIPAVFEFAIDDGGEQTFLLPATILNDMTAPSTLGAAEAAGAIVTVVKEIFVDSGLGEPILLVAPGFSFVPSAAGDTLVITHGLGTWRPRVVVTLHEVDHAIFAGDPTSLTAALTGSRELKQTEFGEHATSANIVRISLPWELVNDPTSVFDFRLLRIDVTSPDAVLKTWSVKTSWDDCLDTLPSGTSLRTKLAALQAMITSLAGGLSISGSNIANNSIDVSKLDLTSLINALTTSNAFATALNTILNNNQTLISTIAKNLTSNADFLTTLTTVFANNSTLVSNLATLISSNATFNNSLTTLVTQILGSGGVNSNSLLAIALPVTTYIFPGNLPPASVNLDDPRQTTRPLLPAVHSTSVHSLTALPLAAASSHAGELWQNNSGAAITLPGGSVDVSGFFSSNGLQWYRLTQVTGTNSYFPTDQERELWRIEIDDAMLLVGKSLVVSGEVDLRTAVSSNTDLQTYLVVEWGNIISQSSPSTTATNYEDVDWQISTPLLSQRLIVTDVLQPHTYGVTITRGVSTITATRTLYGGTVATSSAPPAATFALRGKLIRWDPRDGTPKPRALVQITTPKGLATIV